MRFLNSAECERWASDFGAELLEWPSRVEGAVCLSGSIERLPASSLYHLARHAVRWVQETGDQWTLVWVREIGIWEGSEDRFLYQLVRKSHGDSQSVEQTPGHAFLRCEVEDGVAVAFLSLSNGWGVSLLAAGSSRAINIDHDGVVRIKAVDIEAAQAFKQYLEKSWPVLVGR